MKKYKDGDVIYIKATVCYEDKQPGNMVRCVTASDGKVLWIAPADIRKDTK